MKNNIILLSFIFLLSCNQQNNNNTVSEISDSTNSTIQSDSSKNEIKQTKDSFQKSLSPGSDTLFFKLKMDSINKHIIIPVFISSGKELLATLSSNDKKANIRVTQIEFPDSTFDGPFGRDLHYKIKTTGNYKIIIGENKMAGDSWKGDFELKVWVK